ncbi:MAG: hypothetical protein J5496_06010 [Lachnospiraceae bacterium]|nr:hypothetical protein [Lachnospiraceae bacterium]
MFCLCLGTLCLLLICAACGKKTGEETAAPSVSAEDQALLDAIREKWPFYFDMDTKKGLSILVVQGFGGAGNAFYSVVPNKKKPESFLAEAYGADLSPEEIKALLRYYGLPDEEIVIHPCTNMFSSVLFRLEEFNQPEIRKLFDDRYAFSEELPGFRNLTEAELEQAKQNVEKKKKEAEHE